MILLRYKSYMDVYARALEEQGIPFRIAGSGGFSGSPEIAELLKIFKALLDPDDPVRLVAVLRGKPFGFSDNQLWLFRKAGRHFNIYSDLPGGLDDDLREMFQWAFDRLKTFREWVQKLPASAAWKGSSRNWGSALRPNWGVGPQPCWASGTMPGVSRRR